MLARELARDLPNLTVRTILLFVFVLLMMRWTGKRTVAALAPFDLAVVIMIGEVAAIPIADLKVDLLHGLWPVLLLGILHVSLATANLHYRRLEELVEGQAALLVKDGRPILRNMRRERVSRRDLQAALRLKNVHDLGDVKEAWMEHSGGISVVLREQARPVSRGLWNESEQGRSATLAVHPSGGGAGGGQRRLGRLLQALGERLGTPAEADDAGVQEDKAEEPDLPEGGRTVH